jgi:nitroimidazol reductase NimA-like FMN-containing flavoprotein (pyridoxamine 5'-phosphate oxidase superfamily)
MQASSMEGLLAELSRLKDRLRGLFESQGVAVLATHSNAGSYASLVAFVSSEDLKCIYFVTSRSTRKYANIKADPRVAMLVDDRSNDPADFRRAAAVTAVGEAKELSGEEKDAVLKRYLEKHGHLKDFVSSPSCALFQLRVQTYYRVTRFQEVMEVHVTQ